jgi:hypothetical protein
MGAPEKEAEMDAKPRWLDIGWLLMGLLILFVGGYYLLRETFGIGLPELNWDAVWPLAIIALGLGILWRTWFAYNHPGAKT